MVTRKFTSSFTFAKYNELWGELKKLLDALGPKKDVKSWQKVSYKSRKYRSHLATLTQEEKSFSIITISGPLLNGKRANESRAKEGLEEEKTKRSR